jgi:hypothetical protein
MQTLIGGQYNACPINLLPTGYMVWSVENEKFKRQWDLFNIELKQRIKLNQEPKVSLQELKDEFWFIEMDTTSQNRYLSMMTTSKWNWTAKKQKDLTARNRLVEVLAKLDELFPSIDEDDSEYAELFEQADDIADELENRNILADILKKPAPVTGLTADQLLEKLRRQHQQTQQQQCYQTITEQIEQITDQILGDDLGYDVWELRDIAWHLEIVQNRLKWIAEQQDNF